MQPNTTAAVNAAADLAAFFDSASYGHANLVLERLPSGDMAWLRSQEPAEPDDALYWPTEAGRDLVARWRAEEALFGPCPTVADAKVTEGKV